MKSRAKAHSILMYSTDPMGSFSSDQFQLSRRNPDNCTCQNSMLHLPVTSKHTSLFWKELPYLPCYFSLSLFFHNEGRTSNIPATTLPSWDLECLSGKMGGVFLSCLGLVGIRSNVCKASATCLPHHLYSTSGDRNLQGWRQWVWARASPCLLTLHSLFSFLPVLSVTLRLMLSVQGSKKPIHPEVLMTDEFKNSTSLESTFIF